MCKYLCKALYFCYMKLTFRYGAFNKQDKPQQKIYIINRQNNKLDFRKSLSITIKREFWDFDNNFIIDTSKKINYTHRNTLYPIIDTLQLLETKFTRRFNELETQTMGFRGTTKEQWKIWSEECIKDVFTPNKPKELNPYLLDLMQDYKDYYKNLKSKTHRHSENTTKFWERQINTLIMFEDYKNHKFRINEITIKDFYNEYHKWCDKGVENKSNGRIVIHSQNTRSGFLKKVIATMRKAEASRKYSTMSLDYKSIEFESDMKRRDDETLTEEEILKIFNYKTTNKVETNLINSIKIQYECCLRYVDLIHNLGIENKNHVKGSRRKEQGKFIVKTRQQIESKITHAKTLKGSDIYNFSCIQPKIKRINSSKIVPISNEIKELLLNAPDNLTLVSNQFYNRQLNILMNKLGINKKITTHCLRKSKCTNLMNLGVTDDEIIIYSGHFSVSELRNTYINWEQVTFKGKHNPNTRNIE